MPKPMLLSLTLITVLTTLTAFAPLAARADEPAPPTATAAEAPPATDELVYARRTVIDFSALTLTGEVERPAGSYVTARKKPKFRTLIRVRGGFLPELLRSPDAL